MCTVIIVTYFFNFIVLPYIRKYCSTQAVPLNQLLIDDEFPETKRLLKSAGLKYLNLVADKKVCLELKLLFNFINVWAWFYLVPSIYDVYNYDSLLPVYNVNNIHKTERS